MNIAIFASGRGTNLEAIIAAVKAGTLKANISVVVSDVKGCFALTRARNANIKTLIFNPQDFKTRLEFDEAVIKSLGEHNIDLIVLAGYMRLISSFFVDKFKNRIMNIHPALLPSFKGTRGIRDALNYGVRVTGVTVHFVDSGLDSGPVILQEAVRIEEGDTEESLAERIHKIEHRIYPEAIRLFTEGKLRIEGRKVRIKL